MAGISREHLNRIEAGKVKLTDDMQDKLMEAVEKFNPDAPMFLLFDYVRIRFPTLDIQHVIRDILKLNIDYMLHEDYGHYKYTEHYYLGDVFVYTSQDEEKGTLLELKGKGCRQFESYLLAQGRSWYDFLMDALIQTYLLHEHGKQRNEPEHPTIHHGTFKHHHDIRVLRTRYFQFSKSRTRKTGSCFLNR